MAWDVPQMNMNAGNQGQVIQQAFSGKPQAQQGGQMQGQPTAASSVDANGNVVATQGQGNPMFRQGSVMGSYFPDAQKAGGMDWGAAIGRLMGFGG